MAGSLMPRARDLGVIVVVLMGLRLVGFRVSIAGSLAVTLIVWVALGAVERRARRRD
jgi:hypothetical protein